MAKTDFHSVDEYIAQQPAERQPVLQRVRRTIRKALPQAEEGISYQIPAYKLDGSPVLYFAGWKEHVSLYPATGRLVSIPEHRAPAVNALYLRRGRFLAPGGRREVMISEAFARANGLDVGSTLGAVIHGRWQTLRRVTLPLIMPGILGGALLVFMSSLDNVSVSLFLADARTSVLPIRMWRMIEESLDVRVAAISGVVIAVTFILVVTASFFGNLVPKQK